MIWPIGCLLREVFRTETPSVWQRMYLIEIGRIGTIVRLVKPLPVLLFLMLDPLGFLNTHHFNIQLGMILLLQFYSVRHAFRHMLQVHVDGVDLVVQRHAFVFEEVLDGSALERVYLPLALGLKLDLNFFLRVSHLLLMNIYFSAMSFSASSWE